MEKLEELHLICALTIEEIRKLVYEEYVENGYKEMWEIPTRRHSDLAELGLIMTEISEAMEEIRNETITKEKLITEGIDIIIRVLNFLSRKYGDSFNIQEMIEAKHKRNLQRGILHGRTV